MGDDPNDDPNKAEGEVLAADLVFKKTWYGDHYTVWNCQILPPGNEATAKEVHVGEWYPGAFCKGASITAAGRFHPQGGDRGMGFIQADSITDDDSHARFTERAAPMDGPAPPITGSVAYPVPIMDPAGEAGRIGWVFDVHDHDTYTVVMRGGECPDEVVDQNSVRVIKARRDAGGVIHATEIQDLTASHVVKVKGTRRLRKWRWPVNALIAAVFAVALWLVASVFHETAPHILALVWSVACLAGAAIMMWAFTRVGHRT